MTTALVIVHLSSLDSYAEQVGERAGAQLANRIVAAIREHDGPVYIIDQAWDGPLRDHVADATRDVAVTWMQFDEDVSDWNVFLPKLRRRLQRDRVDRVVIGGVWYDPELAEGCATTVYLFLRRTLPAKVNESIVGCWTDAS